MYTFYCIIVQKSECFSVLLFYRYNDMSVQSDGAHILFWVDLLIRFNHWIGWNNFGILNGFAVCQATNTGTGTI